MAGPSSTGRDGRRYRFDVVTRRVSEPAQAPPAPARNGRGRPAPDAPERGRQFASALSPDGRLKAFYRDRNLWLSACGRHERARGDHRRQRPSARSSTARRAGCMAKSSNQRTAMWWSPDSRKLAYYRFDERPVPRLLCRAEPDAAAGHGRHRGVPEIRRSKSGRRRVRLRRGRAAVGRASMSATASRSTTTSSGTTCIT